MRALTLAVSILFAANALAQGTPPVETISGKPGPSNADIAAQLQKLSGKNSKQALAQVVVIGSLLGCTQKTAGKEATNAFYKKMSDVGHRAELLCKESKPAEARALMLSTFKENQNDPVVKAAHGCYEAQKETVATVGGPRMAIDAANYAKWVKDPALAEKEMQNQDICRGKPKTAAAPAQPQKPAL